MRAIADLTLAQTAARLAERGIGLEVTETTMAHICEEGYDQVGREAETLKYCCRLARLTFCPFQ